MSVSCRNCEYSKCYTEGYATGLQCLVWNKKLTSTLNAFSEKAQQEYDAFLAKEAQGCKHFKSDVE